MAGGHQPDDLHAPSRVRRRDRRRRRQGAGDYGEGFAAAAPTRRSPLALVEAVGRFVVHYPSYIVFVALANRMDLFLHAYLAMNAAYAARALLDHRTFELGRAGRAAVAAGQR